MPKRRSASSITSERRRKRSGGDSLWGNATLASLVAGLGLLFAFAIFGWQFVELGGSNSLQQQAKEQHRALTGYFDSRFFHLRRDVSSAANSDFAKAALATAEAQPRINASAQLTQIIAYAERVTIIPKGKGEVDLSADVPITFAGLDVIKRAESQEYVGPEASVNPPGLIYAAAPITRDGSVAGVLFVVFSQQYLLAPLKLAFSKGMGTVRLEQSFEGMAPSPVLQWGNGGEESLQVRERLETPHLELVFEPAPASSNGPGWFDLLIPFLLATALSLAGIFWGFIRTNKNLALDAEHLNDGLNRLARGRTVPTERYHLSKLQALGDQLANHSEHAVAGTLADANGDDDAAENASAGDNKTPNAASRSGKKATLESKTRALNAAADDSEDDLLVDDLLGDDIDEPDDDFLEVTKPKSKADNFGIEVEETDNASPQDMGLKLDPDIFRAYDIRGITTTNLTANVVYWIGRAFAAEAREHNRARACIGRDGRNSSPELAAALAKGLTEGGLDVLDIGQVPTPVLYYATHALNTGTGIMVTGSHNPPDYNGLKMVLAEETLAEQRITRLYERLQNNELSEGSGSIDAVDIRRSYLDRILEDVAIAQPKKVVVDCGNGVAGNWVPELLEEMGCEVVPLYCEVDGDFPNHHPDPADPKNMEDLLTVVEAEKADIGLAFDGDGDRIGVATPAGKIIWPDKLIMLFSQDIISRNPGADIIYDVKCSRHLNNLISESGGRPIMWKTGHSHIKAKMKETGALLGGEFSGHICFGERWYGFDDAIYSAARLLEIIGAESVSVDDLFDQFPTTFATPELKIHTTDSEKFKIMEKLVQQADFGAGTVTNIDGVRVDYNDGWGLIRPSNTSPVLSLRFEADNEDALEVVKQRFQKQLAKIDPELTF